MLQLLANAHVFAPEDLGVRHVLVGGQRILGLLNDPDDVSTPGLTVSDLDGQRLLPGFIDGHAHITGGGGESGFASRVPPVPVSRFTRAGEEGISAWCHTGGYHVPPVTLTGSVRDDIVFIDPVIGVGELAISDHRSSQPTLDELLRIASDVHVAGLISGKAGILHLHLGDGNRGLAAVRKALSQTELPARVFNPTHVNRQRALLDEALELARAGVVVDITAFPVDDEDDAVPAAVALQRYLASGAPTSNVTISSDGGGCLPVFNNAGEMLSMDIGSPVCLGETLKAVLAAGVPLEVVLPAFTSNVAQLLRLHRKGRICPGGDADLIVLDQHDAIVDVMANGRWHVRNGVQQIYGQFEKEDKV